MEISESGTKTSQYSGPREHPGIAQWIAKQTVKTLPVVELQSDLDNLKAAGIVVALYGESAGYDSEYILYNLLEKKKSDLIS